MTNEHKSDFLSWACKNQDAVSMFIRFADQAWDAGRRTIGAKLIVERMRWETSIVTTGSDFKLNNNHTAYLARLYIKLKPERATLFRFREVKP